MCIGRKIKRCASAVTVGQNMTRTIWTVKGGEVSAGVNPAVEFNRLFTAVLLGLKYSWIDIHNDAGLGHDWTEFCQAQVWTKIFLAQTGFGPKLDDVSQFLQSSVRLRLGFDPNLMMGPDLDKALLGSDWVWTKTWWCQSVLTKLCWAQIGLGPKLDDKSQIWRKICWAQIGLGQNLVGLRFGLRFGQNSWD